MTPTSLRTSSSFTTISISSGRSGDASPAGSRSPSESPRARGQDIESGFERVAVGAPVAPLAQPVALGRVSVRSSASSEALAAAAREISEVPVPKRLEDFYKLSAAENEAIWTQAAARADGTPNPADLNGELRGAALALASDGTGKRDAAWKRWTQSKHFFLWGGKKFTLDASGRGGTGDNRLFEGLLGKRAVHWFPFQWKVAPSQFDDAATRLAQPSDVVQLDYSARVKGSWQNRFPLLPVSTVHDEIRQVAPGLYLGKAGIKPQDRMRRAVANGFFRAFGLEGRARLKSTPELFTWFALEAPNRSPVPESAASRAPSVTLSGADRV